MMSRIGAVAATAAETQLAVALESLGRSLESIIQNSPAPVALMRGPEFTFALVNPAYEAMQAKACLTK